MSPKNDFKAFSISHNANVVNQEKYEESQNLKTGFAPDGITTNILNKALRQSSTISSVVANFIATQSGNDVLDDGNIEKLTAQLNKALEQKIVPKIPDASLTQKGIVQLTDVVGNSNSLAATQKLVSDVNDNANNRLAKNQNGADIPNKNEFVKNLDLLETVNLAKNAVPNSRKINGKALTGDINLGAGDVGAFRLGLTGKYSVDNQVPWNVDSGSYDLLHPKFSDHVVHFYNGVGSCPAFQLKVHYKNGGIAYRSARDNYGFEEDWTSIYTTKNKPTVNELGLSETVALAKNAVPNNRKINGKVLVEDINLEAGDVGAYSRSESDKRYQKKGPNQGWQKIGAGGDSGSSILLSQDIRGRCIYLRTGSPGIFLPLQMPPIDNILVGAGYGSRGWLVVHSSDGGLRLSIVNKEDCPDITEIYIAD
ncbi:phage tail protein [Photorhabdus luminescens]|uniref:phage tail protein n=1 Tax=Photorhabdus luminescens TaxID=29488 RepID=UPI00210ECF5A|nr:phage tail protein [Photorhabdus luminescens]